MRATGRLHGDDGQAGGIEMLPFGLLVFVIGGLVVANAWAVVDAKLATSAAARAGARRAVEADDATTAALTARRAARDAAAGLGRDPDRVDLRVGDDGEPWRRCGRLTVEARYTVPLVSLPWLGGVGRGVSVRSVHSELIDPYRSDLPGEARC
ncbi:MAG: hypothetical protein R2726_01050 [Acidimicrobiales bacterium]